VYLYKTLPFISVELCIRLGVKGNPHSRTTGGTNGYFWSVHHKTEYEYSIYY